MIYVNAAIAAGKSSLTKILSEDLGTKAFYEHVEDIPMLKKFYAHSKESRSQYSFALQIAFLNYRYGQLLEGITLAEQGMRNTVYDSSLLSDSLMAHNLYEQGEFPQEEYDVYVGLLQRMQSNVASRPFNSFPDLVIYLDISFEKMLEHIQLRGREMEDVHKDSTLIAYYKSVWETYRAWSRSYSQSPMVTIDMNNLDFVNSKKDRLTVLDTIERRMYSLGLLSKAEYLKLFDKHTEQYTKLAS